MKLVIDMNLSPDWVPFLTQAGIEAVHWSKVGKPDALDAEIMEWADINNYIVFTHDLDFGTLLALTKAKAPSVIQVRSQDTFVSTIGDLVLSALDQCEEVLKRGALVTVDPNKTRVRLLPF